MRVWIDLLIGSDGEPCWQWAVVSNDKVIKSGIAVNYWAAAGFAGSFIEEVVGKVREQIDPDR